MMKTKMVDIKIPMSTLLLFVVGLNTPLLITINHINDNPNEISMSLYDKHGVIQEETLEYSISRQCITFGSEGWLEDVEDFINTNVSVDRYLEGRRGSLPLGKTFVLPTNTVRSGDFEDLAALIGVTFAKKPIIKGLLDYNEETQITEKWIG